MPAVIPSQLIVGLNVDIQRSDGMSYGDNLAAI